jgi:hypothetical protein
MPIISVVEVLQRETAVAKGITMIISLVVATSLIVP